DITTLDPLELRRRAALVLQTPVLFEGTVRAGGRLSVGRHPISDRGGLHARRRHLARLTALRAAGGSPLSHAGSPAAPLPALTSRRSTETPRRHLDASRSGWLRPRRFRPERSCRITLWPIRPGDLPLACELLAPLLRVVGARQRREKGDHVLKSSQPPKCPRPSGM